MLPEPSTNNEMGRGAFSVFLTELKVKAFMNTEPCCDLRVGESVWYELTNYERTVQVKVDVVSVSSKRVMIRLPKGEVRKVRPYRLSRKRTP